MKKFFYPKLFFSFLILFVTSFFVIKHLHVNESKIREYEKIRQERRGKIRKARENKEKVTFQQEREGVTRQLFIPDESGRRQFFLEAHGAHIDLSVQGKKKVITETFFHPKGWLQEKLFWIIPSSKEKVIMKENVWVYESHPENKVPENLIPDIIALQEVRIFDADQAVWNLESNELVSTKSNFFIVQALGHDLFKNLDKGTILSKGFADSMTLSFDKQGHEKLSCQSMKLDFSKEAP
jgi:hypothetical protein